MIDFSNLQKYRENNRIEAKKAMGGLPEASGDLLCFCQHSWRYHFVGRGRMA